MGKIEDAVAGKLVDPISLTEIVGGVKTGARTFNGLQSTIKVLNEFVFAILYLYTFPITVIIHHSFGVRYFTSLLTLISIAVVWVALFFGSAWNHSLVIWAVMLGYLAALSFHKFQAWRISKKGVAWHSRSCGIPYSFIYRLPYADDEFFVQKIHEPLALIIIGWLMLLIPGVRGVGGFVLTSGVARFLYLHEDEQKYRNKVLDQIDQTIEAETLKRTVEGTRSPKETKGFVVPRFVADHPEVFLPELPQEVVAPDSETVIAQTMREFEIGQEGGES